MQQNSVRPGHLPLLAGAQTSLLMGHAAALREMAIAVAQVIDLFDCVLPTRLGRQRTALVRGEAWNLRNARFSPTNAAPPLMPSCLLACRSPAAPTQATLIRSDLKCWERTLLSLHNLNPWIRFTTAMAAPLPTVGFLAEDFALPGTPGSAAALTRGSVRFEILF